MVTGNRPEGESNLASIKKLIAHGSRVSPEDVPHEIKKFVPTAQSIAQFLATYECPVEQTRINSIKAELEQGDIDEFRRQTLDELLQTLSHGGKKYLNQLQKISDGVSNHFEFDAEDYLDFMAGGEKEDEVTQCLLGNSVRVIRLITIAAENTRNRLCPSRDIFGVALQLGRQRALESAMDVWYRAPFEVYIAPPSALPVQGIRDVVDKRIGQLIKIDVQVVKVSGRRPRIKIARYECQMCSADVFQPVEDVEYLPTKNCESEACKQSSTLSELLLLRRESVYLNCEEVTVQEPQHLTPPGNVPRRMKVLVEGHLTGQLRPGQGITLTGIPEAEEPQGFQAMRRGPVRNVHILAQHFVLHKSDVIEVVEGELEREVEKLRARTDWYDYLAHSLCPSIFGHMDVKKALLLQLVGGATLDTDEGLKVRGEIHILLMGDPGVAKSQMLSKIMKVAPRAAYTTGKGASGVGLTASVIKDPVTGEFTLEGGAIVLADKGVAAIDEFDKMDEGDRTAIHEVMEQQTVSVSKAGLNVQLVARTSILAAANPVYGRYDTTRSLIENMQLPYSLISRFDFAFVLLDRIDQQADFNLSMYILKAHEKNPELDERDDAATPDILRYYIQKAKGYDPELPGEVAQEIEDQWCKLREDERCFRQAGEREDSYTTVRTLFSIVRISQALARLRFSNTVSLDDVVECCRLMRSSNATLKAANSKSTKRSGLRDRQADLMQLLRVIDRRRRNPTPEEVWMDVSEILVEAQTKGYSKKEVDECLASYVDLCVLTFRSDKTEVAFSDRI